MILVLLGTQDKPFTRLLKIIDRACMLGDISEKVIVQAGHTKYTPHSLSKNMKIYDFISDEKLEKYLDECDLIITHGGVGSIMMGLKKHKKIIAVPRLKKYKEHTNDHQLQIVEKFSKDNYLIYLDNLEKLSETITKMKILRFKDFRTNTNNIVSLIENYIKEN